MRNKKVELVVDERMLLGESAHLAEMGRTGQNLQVLRWWLCTDEMCEGSRGVRSGECRWRQFVVWDAIEHV